MRGKRVAKIPSRAEIENIIARSEREGRDAVHVTAVRYIAADDEVRIDLDTGAALLVPRKRLYTLEDAAPRDLTDVSVEPTGSGIWWNALDTGFTIESLLVRALGKTSWLPTHAARVLGATKSPRKAAASRKNGKKGGRPRKA